MGQEVDRRVFTREDRTLFRAKVRECLDVFARMLRESRFDAENPCTGIEIEFNLVDDRSDPALRNIETLEAIADPEHEEHEAMLDWVGGAFDPEAFDLEGVNTELSKVRL